MPLCKTDSLALLQLQAEDRILVDRYIEFFSFSSLILGFVHITPVAQVSTVPVLS